MSPGGRVRKWVYALAALAAVLLSGPMLPLEIAVWLSGELLLYLELASGLWLTLRAANLKMLAGWLRSNGDRLRDGLAAWARANPSPVSWLHATLSVQ